MTRASQALPIAALGPAGGPTTVPGTSWATLKARAGMLTITGCPFNATTGARVGPIPDLLHIAHGPSGCGHYAQAMRRPSPGTVDGISGFTGLHATSDFHEADVVFGGNIKLNGCLTEAANMFPLARGFSVLSECPVGLIGDDIEAVARQASVDLARPVIPIRCEGFRGKGDLSVQDVKRARRMIAGMAPSAGSPPRTVVLTCLDRGFGHASSVRRLLEAIGLTVVAQYPSARGIAELARMERARLNIVAGLGSGRHFFAEALESEAGVPWIECGFTAPAVIATSLRAIARRFDAEIEDKAESLIAAAEIEVAAVIARYRPRLEGKFYLSLSTLSEHEPAPFQALGLRVGTACQGWPAPDGRWRTLSAAYRYRTLSDAEVVTILREARPDAVTGCGTDVHYLRKMGIEPFDGFGGLDRRSTWGYDGFARLASDLDRALTAPWRRFAIAGP